MTTGVCSYGVRRVCGDGTDVPVHEVILAVYTAPFS
jgi:hypothetical protein